VTPAAETRIAHIVCIVVGRVRSFGRSVAFGRSGHACAYLWRK
jgi:hypothetical protein